MGSAATCNFIVIVIILLIFHSRDSRVNDGSHTSVIEVRTNRVEDKRFQLNEQNIEGADVDGTLNAGGREQRESRVV